MCEHLCLIHVRFTSAMVAVKWCVDQQWSGSFLFFFVSLSIMCCSVFPLELKDRSEDKNPGLKT